MEISVVVPLYNEEDSVEILQNEIESALKGLEYEIIFVDDGSKDKTSDKINLGKRVKLLPFEKNAGQSAAMLAGILASHGKKIVMLDGDLQNDPADIPLLIAELDKGFDIACGYRKNRQDTWSKKIQSRIANAVRSRFTGDGVRDTGCSLKAFRQEFKSAFVPFNGLHRFIPAMIKSAGGKICEVPVNHRARKFGTSKYGIGNRALRATIDMLGVKWLISRRLNYEIKKSKMENLLND